MDQRERHRDPGGPKRNQGNTHIIIIIIIIK
jgi:hypothetical protein